MSNTYILGLDVGGSKCEAAVLRASRGNQFEVLARLRAPTPRQQGADAIVGTITTLCNDVLADAKVSASKIKAMGAGLPGTVNPETGRMVFGNTMALIKKDFSGILKKSLKLKCPIITANDANCFAFAESLLGAGLKHSQSLKKDPHLLSSIGVILGTGVGGGIIMHGHIEAGRIGGAGEIGHTELYTGGHACYCGRRGCAETYLSGSGFEAHFASRIYSQVASRPDARGIFDMYRSGDPVAAGIVLAYRQDLAKFLGNLTNIFDPDYFVLGGGMSNAPEIYKDLRTQVQKHCFIPGAAPKIYKNVLGDSAGVIGAALLTLS